MRIVHLVPSFALLLGCSSQPAPDTLIRLDGSLAGCTNVQEICLETSPPQCFDYCADDDPGTPGDGDCTVSQGPDGADIVLCDGAPCFEADRGDGVTVQLCYPPDCGVSYDAETGVETIECPPGGGGGDPGDPVVPDCTTDGGDGFTRYPTGSCGADGADGVCTRIPEVCYEIWGPVCGCDGRTYANDCYADGAGVSVLHLGEC
jgi:hypothetical protein